MNSRNTHICGMPLTFYNLTPNISSAVVTSLPGRSRKIPSHSLSRPPSIPLDPAGGAPDSTNPTRAVARLKLRQVGVATHPCRRFAGAAGQQEEHEGRRSDARLFHPLLRRGNLATDHQISSPRMKCGGFDRMEVCKQFS